MRRTPARALALTASALLLTTSACGGELEIGDATTVVEGGSTEAPTETPTETAEPEPLDPRLAPEPSAVGVDGAMTLHLPYGWDAYPGSDMGAAGASALIGGGIKVTSVSAEGKSVEEWVEALRSGTTEHFADAQGMVENPAVTTAAGVELFHLVQAYSSNQAQLFGTVVDDTLHLVRFGLDGSDEAVEVATKSAATLVLS